LVTYLLWKKFYPFAVATITEENKRGGKFPKAELKFITFFIPILFCAFAIETKLRK
jgi:hypothetical protein